MLDYHDIFDVISKPHCKKKCVKDFSVTDILNIRHKVLEQGKSEFAESYIKTVRNISGKLEWKVGGQNLCVHDWHRLHGIDKSTSYRHINSSVNFPKKVSADVGIKITNEVFRHQTSARQMKCQIFTLPPRSG